MSDGAEINTYATNATNSDTDGDGLTDGAEVNTYGTNPKKSDSDGDAMPDKWEIDNRLVPTGNDAGEDADKDGYTNLQEYNMGTDPNDPNDPYRIDWGQIALIAGTITSVISVPIALVKLYNHIKAAKQQSK